MTTGQKKDWDDWEKKCIAFARDLSNKLLSSPKMPVSHFLLWLRQHPGLILSPLGVLEAEFHIQKCPRHLCLLGVPFTCEGQKEKALPLPHSSSLKASQRTKMLLTTLVSFRHFFISHLNAWYSLDTVVGTVVLWDWVLMLPSPSSICLWLDRPINLREEVLRLGISLY